MAQWCFGQAVAYLITAVEKWGQGLQIGCGPLVDIAVHRRGRAHLAHPALEMLADGTLVAAYDRRTEDSSNLPGDLDTMVRRSHDDGRT